MTAINPAIAAAIAAAKAAEDQSKVQKGGGGDYTPPPAGKTLARLVAYLELGKESYKYQGKDKVKDKVRFVFELIGKKHPPREVEIDGTVHKFPVLITLNMNKSFSENGGWRKLFAKLNWAGDITHAAEAVGRAFLVDVVHNIVAGKDGQPDRTFANLTNEAKEYLIGAPQSITIDDDTGEEVVKVLNCGPALSPLRYFFWDHATKEQWDSIFIDGSYAEELNDDGSVKRAARSKNVLQEEIKKATNYVGSAIYNLLAQGGDELDIPDAEQPARPSESGATPPANAGAGTAADEDPLAGV